MGCKRMRRPKEEPAPVSVVALQSKLEVPSLRLMTARSHTLSVLLLFSRSFGRLSPCAGPFLFLVLGFARAWLRLLQPLAIAAARGRGGFVAQRIFAKTRRPWPRSSAPESRAALPAAARGEMSQLPVVGHVDGRRSGASSWREQKQSMIAVRSLGLEQGRALSHLVKHTEQMFTREVKDTTMRVLQSNVREQRSLRLGKERLKSMQSPLRKTPLHLSKVRLRVDEKPTTAPRRASTSHSERRSDHQARIGDLTQNLPLIFLSQPEGPNLLEASITSEPSRALERYSSHAKERPNLRYHLPYTESFIESHRASPVPTTSEEGREDLAVDGSLQGDVDLGDIAARLSSTLTLNLPTTRRFPVPNYDPKAAIDYLALSSPSPRSPKHRRF